MIKMSGDTREYLGEPLIAFLEGLDPDLKPSVILSSLDFDETPEAERLKDQFARRALLKGIGADYLTTNKIERALSTLPYGRAFLSQNTETGLFGRNEDALYFFAATKAQELKRQANFDEGHFDYTTINPKDDAAKVIFHEAGHMQARQGTMREETGELDAERTARALYTKAYDQGLVSTPPDTIFAFWEKKRLIGQFEYFLGVDTPFQRLGLTIAKFDFPPHILTTYAGVQETETTPNPRELLVEYYTARAAMIEHIAAQKGLEPKAINTDFVFSQLLRLQVTNEQSRNITDASQSLTSVQLTDTGILIDMIPSHIDPFQIQLLDTLKIEVQHIETMELLRDDPKAIYAALQSAHKDGVFDQYPHFKTVVEKFFEAAQEVAPQRFGIQAATAEAAPETPSSESEYAPIP